MNLERTPQNEREFLAQTGYTIDDFLALVPHFESQFKTYMSEYTFEGYKRLNRKYVSYKNSPLPTTESKLYLILIYLKQRPTQKAHAQMFGLTQPKANRWLRILHTVFRNTLESLGQSVPLF